MNRRTLTAPLVASFCILAMALPAGAAADVRGTADELLKLSGLRGGMIVHLGCGDGALTAALGRSDRFLVHGLSRDAAEVAAARARLVRSGSNGRISVARLTGRRLPYVDNLVNVLIVEDASGIAREELLRVLAPRGAGMIREGKAWSRVLKPCPSAYDDWTHYLYDATNNAVSKDKAIRPLTRMQWVGSPRWSRHHDHMSSMSSLVSAGGRLFYIFDEGSTASIVLPSDWKLIARDGFNGAVLWKRPIEKWFTQLWPLKSGPALLTRRLVAVGDEVYTTLAIDGPTVALDAATGETLRTYEGTAGTDEIICSDGVLFLAVNKAPGKRWGGPRNSVSAIRRQVRDARWAKADSVVVALSADTGQELWRHETNLSPSTLAVDGGRVVFHDGERVVALDRKTGRRQWASQPLPMWSPKAVQSWFVPILVLYEDVVLWAGGEEMRPHRGGKDVMTALDAATGKKLWQAEHAASGYQSAEDLLVAGGLVWTGATTSGSYDGVFRGHDPRTGELRKQFGPQMRPYWFHHRCHRGKATEDYLLMSRTGIEYLDIEREKYILHHWVRGACLTGILPANGMVYAPPHDCACYPEAKVFGFAAMAPPSEAMDAIRAEADDDRLEKGPAYGDVEAPETASEGDWPTYRRDGTRNAFTPVAVEAEVKPAWACPMPGPLSSMTVAEGKLFVAQIDAHTVHALDADTGQAVWKHAAGGRVDSPPTIHRGLCLFGSADGYVTCLRAADGELVWRFRAAPIDQRQTAFEQVESVWPVHGSVLVHDGVLYALAGRSMLLDGGLDLYRLDPATGKVLGHRHYDEKDPETGKHLQTRHQTLQMPVALADILATDGKHLYMRSQVMDFTGKRTELGPHTGDLVRQATYQRGETAHLFAPYGFLDSSWFHRSYWVFGRSFSGGHGGYHQAGKFAPSGRLLVADDKNAYGYGRKPQYLRWTTALEYQLFASDRRPPELPYIPARRKGRSNSGPWVNVENYPGMNPAGKPLAVEAWVKTDKPNGVVVARGGPAHGYALMLRKGKPAFAVRVDSNSFRVEAERAIGKDWTHLAGVLTGDKQLQVYVDGELAGTARAGGFIVEDPAQELQIGADADTGQGVGDYEGPFNLGGAIDEVRVFFGTVSAEEIAAHAAEPENASAKDARLVARLTFDKGRARDVSGLKHHGKAPQIETIEGRAGLALKLPDKAKTGKKRPRRNHFVEYHWTIDTPPVVARAMVLADKTLFVAGPPDVVNEDEAVGNMTGKEMVERLAKQDRALAGKAGGLLLAVDAETGKTLAKTDLKAPPAWDALIAAKGRLYLATTDGRIVCLAP